MLLAQLSRLEAQCTKRDANGQLLTELLSKIDGVRPQIRDHRLTRHGHYLFTFVLEADIPREGFKRTLANEGVPLQLEYPAVSTLDFIRQHNPHQKRLPVCELLAQRSIWLYHEALLAGPDFIKFIAEAVRTAIDGI